MNTALLSLLLLAASTPLAAAGVPVAAPLEGRMIVSAEPGSLASNGDGFLVAWGLRGPRGPEPTAVAIDRTGRRTVGPFGLRPGCGAILPFESGYIVTCYESGRTSIRRLNSIGEEIGVITAGLPREAAIAKHGGALATNGDRILVVAGDHTPELRVIDAGEAQIGPTTRLQHRSHVTAAAPTAAGFAILSIDPYVTGPPVHRVHAISRDGSLRYEVPLEPTRAAEIQIGAVGDDVLVVWSDYTPTVHTAWISPSGIVTLKESAAHGFHVVTVISDGDAALVIGKRHHDHATPGAAVVARFARGGAAVDVVSIASPLTVVGAASNGNVLYLLTRRWNGVGDDAVGLSLPINALSSPPKEEILSIGPLAQHGVAAASAGESAIVAWHEHAVDRAFIRVRRVRNGEPVGDVTEVFAATSGVSIPQIASNGTVALIVWIGQAGIQAKRVDSSGSILDHQPLQISLKGAATRGYSALAVASDGRDFLVAWVENFQNHQILAENYQTVATAVVSASGATGSARAVVKGAPLVIDQMLRRWEDRNALSVAWDRDRYVLVWTHEQWSSIIAAGIDWRSLRMISVSRDASTALTAETAVAGDLAEARVAAAGGVIGILAEQPYGGRQYALIVDSASGSVIARHELGRGVSREGWRGGWADGAAAWNGHEFLFAWRDSARSYITRLAIGGNPQSSVVENTPIESILIVTPAAVEFLSVERRVGATTTTPQVFAYRESDFTPLGARRRLVRR